MWVITNGATTNRATTRVAPTGWMGATCKGRACLCPNQATIRVAPRIRLMKYDPTKHHRRSIRLKNYDYSGAGFYFVTICTQHHGLRFGDVVNNHLKLNEAGAMVQSVWLEVPTRFSNVELDEFVVMPNHFHGILIINDVGAQSGQPQSGQPQGLPLHDEPVGAGLVLVQDVPAPNTPARLGDIVGAFKSMTTHQYIQSVKNDGWPPFDRRLWQRNYWEHIIRTETALHQIREYVQNNPARWAEDQLHPDAPPNKFNRQLP